MSDALLWMNPRNGNSTFCSYADILDMDMDMDMEMDMDIMDIRGF